VGKKNVWVSNENIASYGQKVIVKKRMGLKSLTLIVIIMTISNLVTAELNVNYHKEGLITLSNNYEKLNKQIKVEILKLNCIEDQQHLLQLQSKYIQEFKEQADLLSNAINDYEKSLATGISEEMHNQIVQRSSQIIKIATLHRKIFEDKIQRIRNAEYERIKNFLKSQ
jgi:hypothetical protein